MKPGTSITCFFLLLCIGTSAQQLFAPQKIKHIAGQYASFSVDNLDNIYLLNNSNQLKKLSATGEPVAVYNNSKKFGELPQMDVSNPLNILLYYKNFATIAVLDGMLSLKNSIDLRKKNMPLVSAVGLSYDNKIWIYDDLENTLKKIDDQGNVILKTSDFRQLFTVVPTPQSIFDRNKLVYLYDPNTGVYIFDYYGALKNKILITGWDNLVVGASYIWGNDTKNIYRYRFNNFRYDEWPLPPGFESYTNYLFKDNIFYALNKDGLDIYSYH